MTENKEIIVIQGVEIHLSHKVGSTQEWIGQQEPLDQLMACWLTLSPKDKPLSPRIIGVPGMGKTSLAMAAARRRNQDLYIFQCTSDTRPEDLLVTPVLGQKGSIMYHASALLTAMIRGGIVVLDEGNRMPEKSWAALASLLDDRRMIESIVAGINVTAHPEFRFVVTMNDDSSTYEIPDYIMSRLQPAIELPFPGQDEEMRILRYNLPESPEELLNICVGYLQEAHDLGLPISLRDGLHIIRYAQRLNTISQSSWKEKFLQATSQILGPEALDLQKLVEKRKLEDQEYGGDPEMGDFFFGDEPPEDSGPLGKG